MPGPLSPGWFSNLAPGVKLALGAIALLALVALLTTLMGTRALWVMLAGAVFVLLLLAGYAQVLRLLESRKAKPMEWAISSTASATPMGLSDAARRARLDDLRRKFDEGVGKFRAAGKNLYALPWYLLVGEPGSGKTEAVRHCGVGFPAGLQDELQGAGGTLNMNWWFTNHAVVLDTAGRLMFEEVEAGSTTEWQEFLRLLRKARPNCPVNGMLLVIPAESLIKDSAEAITRKAGKIARQLDTIQRELGVRFPVFVVVTKCDLINGFREFFDTLAEPAAQNQILGWSNPASLDEPFQPELVDQHLAHVQENLVRRRTAILRDPVHTENPTARRTDEVDALYAFPDSLAKLAPRLRTYLNTIFVAGAWAAKPLFLRGIYFTSSMREGAALDAELAEALGVPVDSLPEGKIWEREKSYFLRDLFMDKVFRERGLVTRALDTGKLQRTRRAAVLALAAFGVLGLGAFTFFGSRALDRSIAGPTSFWSAAGNVFLANSRPPEPALGTSEHLLPIVSKASLGDEDFKYRGGEGADATPLTPIETGDRELTLGTFPALLKERAGERLAVPLIFAPVAVATGDGAGDLLAPERAHAARVLFDGSVLRPLVESARARLRALSDPASPKPWPPEATEALAQLVRAHSGDKPVDLDPLLRFVLLGNDHYLARGAERDAPGLQGALSFLYAPGPGNQPWPPALLEGRQAEDLDRAVTALTTALTSGTATSGGDFPAILRLARAADEYLAAERPLLAPEASPAGVLDTWRDRFAALDAAAKRFDETRAALKSRTLAAAFDEELDASRQAGRKQLERLLAELPADASNDPAAAALFPLRTKIAAAMEALTKDSPAVTRLRARLPELDAAAVGPGPLPRLLARHDLYKLIDARAPRPGAEPPDLRPGALRTALSDRDRAAIDDARRLSSLVSADASLKPAGDLAEQVLRQVDRAAQGSLLDRYAATAPQSPEDFAKAVADAAEAAGFIDARPAVPLTQTRANFSPKFSPRAAARLVGDALAARRVLGENPGLIRGETARQRVQQASDAARAYLAAYVDHWTTGLAEQEYAPLPADAARTELAVIAGVDALTAPLAQVLAAQTQALDELVRVVDRRADTAAAALVDRLGASVAAGQPFLAADNRARLEDRLRAAKAGTPPPASPAPSAVEAVFTGALRAGAAK
jgi:hypothetical protein